MSNEERIVRLTYAKTAYAVQVGSVHRYLGVRKRDNPSELRSQLEQERLQFELSNFVVGNISELATRPYSNLVTKLGEGDEVDISMREDNVGENGIDTFEFNANASWNKGRDSRENWDNPAKVVFETMENPEWYSRYANFRVTVTYQGRSRTYKALFLIGNFGGEQKVIALDNVTNNSGLTFFAKASVHPTTLLKTRLHSNRAVAEWLRSQANSEPSCQIQKGEACCDAATMKCSLAKDEVDAQLASPTSTLSRSSRDLLTHGLLRNRLDRCRLQQLHIL